MALPKISPVELIPTSAIPPDPEFKDLRIIHTDTDSEEAKNFDGNRYEVQHEMGTVQVWGVLSLKGVRHGPRGDSGYRLTFTPANLTLKDFCKLIKYDPANPPEDDYQALDMAEAHEQTQSDFKGAKKTNLNDFKNYVIEGMRGERTLYLPAIAAWQSHTAFEKTVFVGVHQPVPGAYYGVLFLPDMPSMQADGQTQTGALFAVDVTRMAKDERDRFFVSVEIELDVTPEAAAQSFADRNGRGTKKNKNLVAKYNHVDGLPTLREGAIKGTVFEERYHDGRNTGTGETATENIIDLSTLEQICMNVISGGNAKPEHIKAYHVDSLKPFVHDFLQMLDRVFADSWPAKTPEGCDPYRREFVHGWPFALKAMALAYYESRQNEIAPYYEAIKVLDPNDLAEETEESYLSRVKQRQDEWDSRTPPTLTPVELESRLSEIEWHRWKKHWVSITGHPVTDTGKPKTKKLADGRVVVATSAPNTASVISAVKNKLVSAAWTDLTKDDDFPLSGTT